MTMSNLAATTFNYAHGSGAVTLKITSDSCSLHSIIVNTAGTTITVYDGTVAQAKVIAVIGAATGVLTYDLTLVNGLTVVSTGSPDFTVTGTF